MDSKIGDLKNLQYNEKEDADLQAEVYKNIHDLIGVEGIIRSQQAEIQKEKLKVRMDNQFYLMKHPQLHTMISLFIKKVLEQRPTKLLECAGKFFDRPKLRSIVQTAQKKEIQQRKRNEELEEETKLV